MRARIYLWLSLLTFCCCCCCRWTLLLNHYADGKPCSSPLHAFVFFVLCPALCRRC